MSTLEAAATKAELRRQALAALRRAPATAEESRAIAERLVALPPFAGATSVALYVALAGEPSDGLLWKAARDRLVCCVGLGPDGPELRRAVRRDALQRTVNGFYEPPPGPAIDPGSVDLFVVPGLAFDHRGARLGRGGGYYDRVLARAGEASVLVGVAPERCLVAALPREPHDVAVDWIVTEVRALPCGPSVAF